MKRCDICKYQKDCPDIVDIDSIWCITHRRIPKGFNNEYIPKQQLVSFLEDKIKEKADTIKIDKRDTVEEIEKIISRQLGELNAYQEVLDFVNKGGKEWKDY